MYRAYNINNLPYGAAEAICEKYGGHLVTITSAEEQAAVEKALTACDYSLAMYWLGAKEYNGKWEWITGEPWEYENWCPWEPTGNQGRAVMLTSVAKVMLDKGIMHGWWLDNPGGGIDWEGIPFTVENTGFICEWENVTKGDLSGDGKITIEDALLAIKASFDNTSWAVGDMNDDNALSLLDILRILRTVANG